MENVALKVIAGIEYPIRAEVVRDVCNGFGYAFVGDAVHDGILWREHVFFSIAAYYVVIHVLFVEQIAVDVPVWQVEIYLSVTIIIIIWIIVRYHWIGRNKRNVVWLQ